MAWTFTKWSPDDSAGRVEDVTRPGVWKRITRFYTDGHANRPLERIVEIAKSHSIKSVVIEQRYIDAHWRSEHEQFYGRTFRRYPTVCHRLHFFNKHVSVDLGNLEACVDHYIGYAVMRPIPWAPVGRTMIAPPSELSEGVACVAVDRVNLFGTTLLIEAMPYVSQDAEYLRCAHSCLWMVLYHSHLVHGTNRRLPGAIHEASMGGVVVGRQVPSEGLSVSQMLSAATKLGLSPGLLDLPESSGKSTRAGLLGLHDVICRYVNSELPPIIFSKTHTWIVVGYRRVANSDGSPGVQIWRHDDKLGPYTSVDDPWSEPGDDHRPWLAAFLPLLPKMYVSAERAEAAGRFWFAHHIEAAQDAGGIIDRAAKNGDLTFQTYVISSSRYKEDLQGRGIDADLVRLYRFAHLPKYIWVIEAVDRSLRNTYDQRGYVLGEAIFDATSNSLTRFWQSGESGLLAFHGGDYAYRVGPDYGQARQVFLRESTAYHTGRPNAARTRRAWVPSTRRPPDDPDTEDCRLTPAGP